MGGCEGEVPSGDQYILEKSNKFPNQTNPEIEHNFQKGFLHVSQLFYV